MAADIADTFGEVGSDDDIADVIAGADVELQWILVAEHAEAGVAGGDGDAVMARQLILVWVMAADRRLAARIHRLFIGSLTRGLSVAKYWFTAR